MSSIVSFALEVVAQLEHLVAIHRRHCSRAHMKRMRQHERGTSFHGVFDVFAREEVLLALALHRDLSIVCKCNSILAKTTRQPLAFEQDRADGFGRKRHDNRAVEAQLLHKVRQRAAVIQVAVQNKHSAKRRLKRGLVNGQVRDEERVDDLRELARLRHEAEVRKPPVIVVPLPENAREIVRNKSEVLHHVHSAIEHQIPSAWQVIVSALQSGKRNRTD